jgi:hypothetical protein
MLLRLPRHYSVAAACTFCHAALYFIAKENGLVPIEKDNIPRGARIPVRTRTAAKGKKNTPKGICRQSKAAISAFLFQGRDALGKCVVGATM